MCAPLNQKSTLENFTTNLSAEFETVFTVPGLLNREVATRKFLFWIPDYKPVEQKITKFVHKSQ